MIHFFHFAPAAYTLHTLTGARAAIAGNKKKLPINELIRRSKPLKASAELSMNAKTSTNRFRKLMKRFN